MQYKTHPTVGEWILRRTRTRNIRAVFNSQGHLEIRAPKRAPLIYINTFISKHEEWIKAQHLEVVEFKVGDSIIDYKIIRCAKDDGVHISKQKKTICVGEKNDIQSLEVQRIIWKKTSSVITDFSKAHLIKRAKFLAAKHNLQPSSYNVRAMGSRWGSCSSAGKVTLSSYLIFLDQALIDYVILHELAHLKHLNHSKDFWNEVATMYPNYRDKRKAIKTLRPKVYINTTPKVSNDVQYA